MSREIKFQFLYKGLPFSSIDAECNWFKKVYTLEQLTGTPLQKLSDVHNQAELIAKREFTGLQACNGIDIYEGDIIYLAGYGNYVAEFPFIELYEAAAENDIGGIIGNIYNQNKDLI